jgi:hypothetical protein
VHLAEVIEDNLSATLLDHVIEAVFVVQQHHQRGARPAGLLELLGWKPHERPQEGDDRVVFQAIGGADARAQRFRRRAQRPCEGIDRGA